MGWREAKGRSREAGAILDPRRAVVAAVVAAVAAPASVLASYLLEDKPSTSRARVRAAHGSPNLRYVSCSRNLSFFSFP